MKTSESESYVVVAWHKSVQHKAFHLVLSCLLHRPCRWRCLDLKPCVKEDRSVKSRKIYRWYIPLVNPMNSNEKDKVKFLRIEAFKYISCAQFCWTSICRHGYEDSPDDQTSKIAHDALNVTGRAKWGHTSLASVWSSVRWTITNANAKANMVRCNIACRTRFWNMSSIQTCNDIKGRFAHWRHLWRPWSSSCALESGTQEVATIGATCLSPKGHQRLADVVLKSGEQDGIRLFFHGLWRPREQFKCRLWLSRLRTAHFGLNRRGGARAEPREKMEAGQMHLDFAGVVLCSPAKERATCSKNHLIAVTYHSFGYEVFSFSRFLVSAINHAYVRARAEWNWTMESGSWQWQEATS